MVTEAQLSHYWLYFFRKLLFNQQLLIQKILGQRCKATTLKSIAVSKYHCYCLFFQKTTAIAYFFKIPLLLLIFSKDHCHCLSFQKITAIAHFFKRPLSLLTFSKDPCYCLFFQKGRCAKIKMKYLTIILQNGPKTLSNFLDTGWPSIFFSLETIRLSPRNSLQNTTKIIASFSRHWETSTF